MKTGDVSGIQGFLKDYPGMSLAPSRGPGIVLIGIFSFSAKPPNGIEINDSYHLKIVWPVDFPKKLPEITEIDGKIPRDPDHHINGDDTFCLGSPLRILKAVSGQQDIVKFAEHCLVPYLYAISYELEGYGKFPFGELDHGKPGIIDDYLDLFGLDNEKQVLQAITLLGKKPRIANKLPCPCGCGLRLGKCSFNQKLGEYRKLASRSWYKAYAKTM